MILKHSGVAPKLSPTSTVTKDATVCGDVEIGDNTVVMNGARLIAEGGTIRIGRNCVIFENAVLRSTARHSLTIGDDVLIGPNAHIVGCTIENNVFIATGASIFHGATIGEGAEVRINGTVHIKSVLPKNGTIPIGWIGVGSPIKILPPDRHEEIWKVQRPLNFPLFVYGVERPKEGSSNMPLITAELIRTLRQHSTDEIIE